MNDRRFSLTEEDLHGFTDGRLDTERHRQIAEYLANHPGCADEVEAYRTLNARLRGAYDPVAEEPIPVRLLRAASGGEVSPAPRQRRPARMIAAVVVAAMLGAAAGWFGRDISTEAPEWRDFAQQAAIAHRLYAAGHPDPVEYGGDPKRNLLADLSRRLGAPIPLVPLDAFGYGLTGARLLPATTGPAVQLLYEDATGHRLSLYLRADLDNAREIEFQFSRIGDVNVLYWLDGPRGYAFSGRIDRPALVRLAEIFYQEVGL